jgi:alkylation response protein AidB-like acyl-CoA dehydrogenase
MNFDLTEEQRLLADSIRRFIANDYAFEARQRIIASAEGYSAEIWTTIAEMGLLALPLPAEHDGFGGSAGDLMTVMDAIGEALVVEPYLSTLIGARFVMRGGSAEQQKQILPAVASGALKLAFAYLEDGARYDLGHVSTAAKPSGDGWTLSGTKRVVLHAPMADRLIVSARHDKGIALFLVDASRRSREGGARHSRPRQQLSGAGSGGNPVSMNPYRTLENFRASDVVFNDTPAELLGNGSDALPLVEEVVDWATALICAEAVGAMRSANDATLEYLKTRKQFGMPIGAFQALQHRMVDMVISCEQARSMASLACSQVDSAPDANARKRVVSAAKLRIADACRHISQESIQLHGGMGMSEELKVSHTFRRLTMIAQQFGDADHHLERFASL